MALIPLRCPSCGANVSLDDNKEFGFCSHCGTKMLIERSDRVTYIIDRSKELQNYLLRAKDFFDNYDYDNAELYANKVLDIDFNYGEAKVIYQNARRALRGDNVTIYRKPSWSGAAVKMHVYIDGKEIAKLKEGEKISLRLKEGQHELYTKPTLNHKSKPLMLSVDRYTRFDFVTYMSFSTVLKQI